MEIILKSTGVFLVALALFHAVFPHYFNWNAELKKISQVTRQIVYVHTFFIGLVLFLMGLLCLLYSVELLNDPMGEIISAGLSVFWISRLCIQWFGFSKALWKGKRFETCIHILFSVFWVLLSFVFILTWWFHAKN